MSKWVATESNLPVYGERVISSDKWKAVINEIYDYLHITRTANYGITEPSAENGELWYDTNVGENKLKVKTSTGWSGISSDLAIASATTLGGIKVGTDLTITNSILSVDGKTTSTVDGIVKAESSGKINDNWLNTTIARIDSPTFTGTVTSPTFSGALTGNAATATKLAADRTISLTGDVTGSASFDGSVNASITATVADDSHNHTIANVDSLQTTLDGKSASSHTHNYAPISHTHSYAPISHTHSYAPIPTSSALPVGMVCMCLNIAPTNITNGSTIAGSSLKPVSVSISSTGSAKYNNSAVLTGTWKNITGVTIVKVSGNSTDFGLFVRTA